MSICLCYDNEHSKDGIGAQVLRIIQVYCLAREYGLGFVSRNILQFDSAPTDNFDLENPKELYFEKVREYLQLDAIACTKEHTVHHLKISKFLTVPILLRLWVSQRNWRSRRVQSHELWIVKDPYGLTLHKPNILRHFRLSRPPLDKSLKQENTFNIQIHIRRAAISEHIQSERYTPTEWYLKILTDITTALEENHQFYKIIIHTDVAQENLNISTSGLSKESLAYSKTRGLVVNEDETITLEYEDFLTSFEMFKNVEIVSNINPIDAWRIMQQADLLILARSTFSVIPALLIQDGFVISPKGFFNGPMEWIYFDDLAELDVVNLQKIIATKSEPYRTEGNPTTGNSSWS